MAILKGFPPSNTISCGTRIPSVVPTSAFLSDLKPGDKFWYYDNEFCVIERDKTWGIKVVCYKSGDSAYEPGGIYYFQELTEVVHLKLVY